MSEPIASPFDEHTAPRSQFHLRHLFGLTTLTAIAAAIAAHLGPGTLFTTGGIILAWINWCGAFRVVHSGWRQSLTLWLAWIAFLVSLALPSFRIFGTVYGWGAGWLALTLPAEGLWRGEVHVVPLLWFGAIDVANLFAISLPILIWRLSVGRGQFVREIFIVSMIGPWLAGADLNMGVGYQVWASSFYTALTALPVRSWTLAALVAAALFALCAAWMGNVAF
jgi:hypothetical protein